MKKLILLFLMCLSGCAISPFLGPAGDAIVAWKDGEADRYYNASSEAIYKATKSSLIKLGIPILKDEAVRPGTYNLVAGHGDKFKINITNKNIHITCVKIRVNFMGDHDYAELIFGTISKEIYVINFPKT
jgi:hypothetical protein